MNSTESLPGSRDDRSEFQMHIMDRVSKNIDWAVVDRAKQAEAARAAVERRKFLYGRLFRRPVRNRDVAALRTEDQAREMFRRALNQFDLPLQIEILHVAVDNRWGTLVTAFIKAWDGEHPISKTVQELWTLIQTTGRAAV